MLRKSAILSIIINVILLLVYFNCFCCKQSFTEYDLIQDSFEKGNRIVEKKNDDIISHVSIFSEMKPELDAAIQSEFCMNEIIVDEFYSFSNSLLNANDNNLGEIFNKYKTSLVEFKDAYAIHLNQAQEIAKLKDGEVQEHIQSFESDVDSFSLELEDVSKVYHSSKELLLTTMKTHLGIIQYKANNDFVRFVASRRLTCFNSPFAVVSELKTQIKKGEIINTKIGWYEHLEYWHKDYYEIYIDGSKIEKSTFGIKPFQINTDEIGVKNHELIIYWTNPISREIGMDTTYLKYDVIN